MLNPVTRLYANPQQASDAVKELKLVGFEDESINVVHPAGHSTDSTENIQKAIMAGQVLRADARNYAEHVRQGRSLVSVQAPFGRGMEAAEILDQYDPIDPGFTEIGHELPQAWDEAAPISSAFRIPVLAKPKTKFLGLPDLTRDGWTLSAAWRLPLLRKSSAPLMGTSLLKGGPTTAGFGIPLTIQGRSGKR